MSIQIQKIGIIGVGTMGAGIAQIAIQSGHDVILFESHIHPKIFEEYLLDYK